MTGSPPDLDRVGLDELKRLLLEALAKISTLTEAMSALSEKNAALSEKNAALHAEVTRLKGLKGPPTIKPSGMEKASTPPAPRGKGGRGGGGGSARMASLEEFVDQTRTRIRKARAVAVASRQRFFLMRVLSNTGNLRP